MGCGSINQIEYNNKNKNIINKNKINNINKIEKKICDDNNLNNHSDENNDIIYVNKNEPEPEIEILIGKEYLPPFDDIMEIIKKNE